MIQIKRISAGEAESFVDRAVIDVSCALWKVTAADDLVLVAGVARESWLGPVELWFVKQPAFKNHLVASVRAMRPLLRWIQEQYPGLHARVEDCDARLAEFVGLRFVGWDEWPDGRRWRKYK